MRGLQREKRRSRSGAAGVEIAGALSIASQMALLCPPGFDEWVRRELTGDDHRAGQDAGRRNGGRRR